MICSRPVVAAEPEQVEKAIKRGVENIYKSLRASGNWENAQMKPASAKDAGTDGGQWGGRTALCTYALLAAGEKPLDPRIVKATDWLRKAQITGHYALGVRANVWLLLPQTDENKQAMAKDARLLVTGVSKAGNNRGFYDYQAGGTRIDISCSQYGVLGAWAAAQRLEEFKKEYWNMVEASWRDQQSADGGWAYEGKTSTKYPETNIQMTAAGVATLFITQEFLHSDAGLDGTKGNIVDPALSRGLEYVAAHFQGLVAEGRNDDRMYAFYGIERIGVASGYKYFGNLDWYQAGADWIVKHQRSDGSWGSEENTSFALLFLSRGRAPVMMNKLQYSITLKGSDKPQEANWNQRPRDAANATRWVAGKTEQALNWQIINLDVANIRDLHDSPILYITGNQVLSFAEPQKALLKQYVEEGGMIVASADAAKPEFVKSFRDLGKELFPEYEFVPIQDKTDVALLSGQMFPASNWKRKPKIEALGNRARTFMVLIPNDDFGRTLQKRDQNRSEVFEFFANAFLYLNDRNDARYKGETHVVRIDPAKPATATAKIARLKYTGRWDPEPGGWNRLTAVMNNADKVKLNIQVVELGKDPMKDYKIAHLTGVEKFTFTDEQRKAVKDFVAGGGLLVIDACGGFGEFDASVQSELSKIFPGEASQIVEPLKKEHPIFNAGAIAKPEPKYRLFAMQKLGADATRFCLRGLTIGGKLGVVYSADDLSVGLVGMPIDGIVGYEPEVANLLMRRIITLKNSGGI